MEKSIKNMDTDVRLSRIKGKFSRVTGFMKKPP